MLPLKNKDTQALAEKIAEAIRSEDTEGFNNLKPVYNELMSKMVRWEILAFQDQVHYLVKNG